MYYSSLATGFNPDNAASVTLTGNSAGYCLTEFAIGCGTKISKAFLKNIRFKLEVNNLLNRKVQIMDSINGNSMILFNPLPTRNYFISASAEFKNQVGPVFSTSGFFAPRHQDCIGTPRR